MNRFLLLALLLAAGSSGCLSDEAPTTLVQPNAFDTSTVQAPTRVFAKPSSTEAAARVDTLGRKIISANPAIGMRPMFQTIGAPTVEIFHRGTNEIIVTEGLVQQCPADERLAAVLCRELGKMVAEREQLAGPSARQPRRLPPIDVPVGNDGTGSMGAADQTRLAELEKYSPRRRPGQAVPVPDPNRLACQYLIKAGYSAADLDAVTGVLQDADKNTGFEKQMTTSPQSRNSSWKAN